MGSDTVIVKGKDLMHFDLNPESEYKVKVYDFKRPDKFSLEQIRTIATIHEAFARSLATTLTGMMQHTVSASLEAVDQCTFEEYLHDVGDSAGLVVLKMNPLLGTMLMELSSPLASYLVEGLYGNSAMPTEDLPLSEIDRVALAYVAERVLPDLRDSWSNVLDSTPEVCQVESNPQHVLIVPPTEMIISIDLNLGFGETFGHLRFAIPYITIEPLISKLSAIYWYTNLSRDGAPRTTIDPANLKSGVEIRYPAERIPLARLSAVCDGEALRLPGAAGGADFVLGGITVARVAVESQTGGPNGEYRILSADAAHPAPEFVALPQEVPGLQGMTRRLEQLSSDIRALSDSQRVLAEDMADEGGTLRDRAGLDTATPAHAPPLSQLIAGERAQTVAFILSLLDKPVAAAVLAILPEERRPIVVERLIRMTETDQLLRRRLSGHLGRVIARQLSTRVAGGPELVAQILNNVPRSVERQVMETFQAKDPELFESVARLMFVFEDLVLVDEAAIRKLMTRVTVEEMALAMKDRPDEVTAHILACLEPAVVQELQTAIKETGRVRRRDVDAAERDVIEELRLLEEAGEVLVARPEEMLE